MKAMVSFMTSFKEFQLLDKAVANYSCYEKGCNFYIVGRTTTVDQ